MTITVKDANSLDVNLLTVGSTTKSIVGGDFMLELAAGNVDGHSVVNKFGSNSSVTGDTQEDVWDGGGSYSYPATALITKVSQTADQAAMRGGEINVQGLDASWDLVVQTINLDASLTTTAVTLTTPLIRIFRMKVQEDVVIDSPIRAHNDAESVDYAIMSIGNNQTLMALYSVPNGKTAFMTSAFFSNIDSTGKTATSTEFNIWAADRGNGYEFQLKHAVAVPEAGNGIQHNFRPYYKFNEKTDIRITALPADEDAHVHAGFDLILVTN